MPKKLKAGVERKKPYSISLDSTTINNFEEACGYNDILPSQQIRRMIKVYVNQYREEMTKKEVGDGK